MTRRRPQPVSTEEILNCARCQQHHLETPFLEEACASVGIEVGRSAAQLLRAYLKGYHQRGHSRLPVSGRW